MRPVGLGRNQSPKVALSDVDPIGHSLSPDLNVRVDFVAFEQITYRLR
jgi:hypothetical protein